MLDLTRNVVFLIWRFLPPFAGFRSFTGRVGSEPSFYSHCSSHAARYKRQRHRRSISSICSNFSVHKSEKWHEVLNKGSACTWETWPWLWACWGHGPDEGNAAVQKANSICTNPGIEGSRHQVHAPAPLQGSALDARA